MKDVLLHVYKINGANVGIPVGSVPHLYPQVSLTGIPGQGVYEIDSSPFQINLTIETVRQSEDIIGEVSLYRDGVVSSVYPAEASGSTYDISVLTDASVPVSAVFQAGCFDAKGESRSNTLKYTFVRPVYHGLLQSIPTTQMVIETLTKTIEDKHNFTKPFNGSGYGVLVYDKSYGELRSIRDANNFENIGAWTFTEIGDFRVYHSLNMAMYPNVNYLFCF